MITRIWFDADSTEVNIWLRENMREGEYVNMFPFKHVDFLHREDALTFSIRFPSKEVEYLKGLGNVQSTN